MIAQASSMSDQDIEDIAAYVSNSHVMADNEEVVGTAPGKASTCAACHGPAGHSSIPENPTLAGQHADYLQQTLQQYREGKRKGPNATVMQAQLATMSDADLAAVIEFYSRQAGLTVLPMD
jgi:cytochrome c553